MNTKDLFTNEYFFFPSCDERKRNESCSEEMSPTLGSNFTASLQTLPAREKLFQNLSKRCTQIFKLAL